MYRNEKQVGQAVRESGIPREDVFVTSKLNNDAHAPKDALEAFGRTLEELGFDYLDLFLIHWPTPGRGDYVETWQALEEIYRSGRAKAIGVSNFNAHHLQKLFDRTETVPAVNQVELHPYLTQEPLRAFNTEHGIATEAWSPIAQGRLLGDSTVQAVAERVGRSAAQVILRWHLQRGNIVFPKSVTLSRVKENFALFDFELSDQDVAAITGLNRDERTGPDPDTLNSF
jgi:2,5-diketo-D-gluconate reductase A